MGMYARHIALLGMRAKDKITGMSGIVDCVGFDLYGCIQASLKPTDMTAEGKPKESYWIDVTRLDVDDAPRVMPLPDFEKGYVAEGKKGPADKPTARA